MRVPDLRMVPTHNAELGLKLARKHQPDVIVTDIDLPRDIEAGFDSYLTKHVGINEVLEAMRKMFAATSCVTPSKASS
ncbi:MAG TPA: hypothetical protein QF891_00180 [Rhodospirillales bacterium]|nr:hypothetical protein [Rhodospirillales bacterium]